MREVAQVVKGLLGSSAKLAGQLLHLLGVVREGLQQAKVYFERDELLLGAVMQVSARSLRRSVSCACTSRRRESLSSSIVPRNSAVRRTLRSTRPAWEARC